MFNYGSMAGQTLGLQENYQPQQYNATGQSLSPTPLDNGAPIANDYSNDQRTAFDFKQQLRQANLDTLGTQDTTNKIVMKDGYLIDKTPDSRIDMARSAAMAAGEAYFAHMGNREDAISASVLAGSQAVSNHADRIKREAMIPQLEAKGYNSLDIEKWRDTGNTKDLIANMGTWTSDGNGFMHNTLTGETKQIEGYSQTKPQQYKYLKNPDGTYTAVNPVTNEPQTGTVGQAKAGAVGTGGGIGLDEDEAANPAFKTDESGGLLKLSGYDKAGNPKYTAANAQDIKQYNASHSSNVPDANTQLVNSDLDTLEHLPDSEIEKFTGHMLGNNVLAQNAYAEYQGADTQAHLAASHRLSTQLGNSAIAAAKNAGASGINTEAELKRFTAGVPQIRYTSVKDYKQSLAEVKQYAENFQKSLMNRSGNKSNSSTENLSDEDLVDMYSKPKSK